MKGVNKVILIGRLGNDPEVRYTTNGTAVANFSLATSDFWKDQSGQKQEKTEWHRIVAWGKTAQLCGEYLKKGRPVYLEGRLQTRSWDDASGNKKYTTEVIVNNLQFLGSAGEAGAPRPQADNSQGMTPKFTEEAPSFESDDDIPF